ncbi:LPXTG cell wall anchor domain-containing protein [Streptococcus danieliae]
MKTLPNTGTEASVLGLLGTLMAGLTSAGAVLTKRKGK